LLHYDRQPLAARPTDDKEHPEYECEGI
jgi:hypothetical protein